MIDLKLEAEKQVQASKDLILGFPWEKKEAYAMWLVQTYQMVNHSTRLVALAGAYVDFTQNDLHARFVDHSKEERGHQLIAVSDLKVMGYSLTDFPCLASSAAMYQIQYYWIQHRGASSFFGYTMALECLSATFGSTLYRRVLAAHGAKGTQFLKVHSEDDIDHIQKAFKQIDKLSNEEKALVLENLEISAELYRTMLSDIQNYLALQVVQLKAS